jgi:G3E family GTPase
MEAGSPIPVSMITGFLGSGKTTLLSRLLRKPEMGETAVIINEFGEIGLDHYLVESANDDIVMLSSGCLCCTVRNDLVDTLRSLYDRREKSEVTPFRRVLVETTGLADPAPILHMLMEDPFVRRHFRLDGVITTIDALYGMGQLDDHPESVKQAAVADRLILTKVDLASSAAMADLRARLQRLNPGASITAADHGEIEPGQLFGVGLYDPATKGADVARWLNAESYGGTMHSDHGHAHEHGRGHAHDVNRHDARIRAHCLVFDEPIDWRYFSPNLASLVSRHADKLLRVKGVLNVAGEPAPIVVHGVQHQFVRLRLEAWPTDDRRSKLVLIVRDLDRDFLVGWLQAHALSGAEGSPKRPNRESASA